MSGAGETNVDGKAHKEGDEVRRKRIEFCFQLLSNEVERFKESPAIWIN